MIAHSREIQFVEALAVDRNSVQIILFHIRRICVGKIIIIIHVLYR